MRCLGSVVPIPDPSTCDFPIKNEPVFGYLKGSAERKELEEALKKTADVTHEVPIVIGDKEYKSGEARYQVRSTEIGGGFVV